jgi:trans-aconitate methyltransferase
LSARVDQPDVLAARMREPEWAAYRDYHRARFDFLMKAVRALAPADGAKLALLDVGPGLQTAMFRRELPRATVNTMGFADRLIAPRAGERHFELNLDEAVRGESPYSAAPHDVIVMAEVIEHLTVPADAVLRFLSAWLAPKGTLIVQTPNAVALHKRLRMLAGRNPYQPIRPSRTNPGHFHEYTLEELSAAARAAGLEPVRVERVNYFTYGGRLGRAYVRAGPVMPPTLRHGMTMWLRAGR